MKTLKIKTVGFIVAALLLLVAVTVIWVSVITVNQANRVGDTWKRFDTTIVAKSEFLSSLRDALGYGGVVHEFKNYLLRRDRARIVRIHERLLDVSTAMTAYLSRGTNERENNAISAIDKTLTQYETAVAFAEKLVSEGIASSEDIERSIDIDDSLALNAIAVLDAELKSARASSAISVYGAVAHATEFAISSAIAVGLLLGILIVAFIWFTRTRLINPLLNITQTMEQLAADNTQVSIPYLDSKDEVGALAKATQVFKEYVVRRDQEELVIRDARERLRAIVENVVDGIITIDAKGTIETLNPASEKIFGYSASEALGQNVRVLMPEPYSGEHDGYLANYLESGEAKIIGIGREVTGLRKDGSTFPMDLAVSEMEIAGQRIFTGIVRDITERKIVDQMKNEFISTVSHELRTPLTSIMGSLGLARSGVTGELPEKLRSMIDIAYNNSGRLVRLINDILDIEKIEAGKMDFRMEALDLMRLVEQVIEENKGFADQNGVELVIIDTVRDAKIEGDRDRLKQVLTNLLSNAVKFSPDGETVEISVSRQEGGYRIAVTDHGPGITEDFQEKIFGKFAQSDSSDARQKGGTGLGLSISKAIVEEHDGSIGFDTETGKGTTFFFDLPDLKEIAAVPIVDEAVRANSERILVCEDDPDIARLLELMLEKEHFVVDVANNATGAREMLAHNSYDAMTLDLVLPDQDGVSFIRELRQEPETKDLPIVVVSAKIEEGVKEIKADAVGIIDWLQKPIDEERLHDCLNRIVRGGAGRKPRILHVEDDPDLANIVSVLAGDLGQITVATTLDEGKRLIREQDFDLIIVDLMLPDGSGEELLTFRGKADREAVPVIVFSAKELPADAAKNIAAALVKSRTTNEQLVATIRTAIQGRF